MSKLSAGESATLAQFNVALEQFLTCSRCPGGASRETWRDLLLEKYPSVAAVVRSRGGSEAVQKLKSQMNHILGGSHEHEKRDWVRC